MNLLTKHLKTRLGHGNPHAVHSVTVFCDFKSVLSPLTDVSPLIPIPNTRYVQSQSSTGHAMTQWLPNVTWAPVLGGLADHPDFLLYMILCREHCRELVQAFRLWRAGTEQQRTPRGKRKSKSIPQTGKPFNSLPCPAE